VANRLSFPSQLPYSPAQGQFFPFFVIAILLLVLLPTTYKAILKKEGSNLILLMPVSDPPVDTHVRIACSCEGCNQKRVRLENRKKQAGRNPAAIRAYVLLSVGWAIIGYMSYRIATTKVENKIWDPYAVLEISTSASMQAIKSHYKKLSRALHPDKVKLVGNMTKEMVESKFVEVTKAYKAYPAPTPLPVREPDVVV
jgi:translocation protein SEC63